MGLLWGWTTVQGMGEALQGSACHSKGAGVEGAQQCPVVFPFTQGLLESAPGHCNQTFLWGPRGTPLAWPGLSGSEADPGEELRGPLPFPDCRALSDPVQPCRLLPAQGKGHIPAAVLGRQPEDLNSLFLQAQARFQTPQQPKSKLPSFHVGPQLLSCCPGPFSTPPHPPLAHSNCSPALSPLNPQGLCCHYSLCLDALLTSAGLVPVTQIFAPMLPPERDSP